MESVIKKPQRNIGADIVRCFACFSVISVHFFMNTEFYSNTVSGEKMYIMTLLRSFFMICVPLFMLLSGYLMRNKKPNAEYYKKIGKTIITYVLACLACILYRIIFLKEIWTFSNVFLNILNYSAAPYAWYIEMYLGFFLLIPFLNILYNNIPSKSAKKLLILVLLINTALPSVLNVYNFSIEGWWSQPSISEAYSKLIPDFWVYIYPFTYYFIGCYLSEYGLKIKNGLNALLIIVVSLISGTYCYWHSYNTLFLWGSWTLYSSLFVTVISVLVFTFFINLNYNGMPYWLQWIFKKISSLSLGAYLVSWIFDQIFYPPITGKVTEITSRMPYFFIMVPLVFVSSITLSWILEIIQSVLNYIWLKTGKKLLNKKSQITTK